MPLLAERRGRCDAEALLTCGAEVTTKSSAISENGIRGGGVVGAVATPLPLVLPQKAEMGVPMRLSDSRCCWEGLVGVSKSGGASLSSDVGAVCPVDDCE